MATKVTECNRAIMLKLLTSLNYLTMKIRNWFIVRLKIMSLFDDEYLKNKLIRSPPYFDMT